MTNTEAPSIDLTELERLAEKATQGQWYVAGPPWLPSDVETYVLAESPDPHAGSMVCDMPTADMAGVEDVYEDDEWRARNNANAAYIAAANPQVVAALVAAVKAALVCREAWIAEAKAMGKVLSMNTATGLLCDYEAKLMIATHPFTTNEDVK